MATKTPVTILEETCAKQIPREKPIFNDLTETPTGNIADPATRFIMSCTALGTSSVGRGATKKTAKHNAAENLLKKYQQKQQNWTDDEDSDDDENEVSRATVNSITELHDYCFLKNWHKPVFTCTSEFGPSHLPTFTLQCQLDSITCEAKAGTKQIAKQNAAKAVLDILKRSYPDSEKKLVSVNDTKEAIRQKVTSYREAKKRNLVDKMGTTIRKRHMFYRKQDQEFTKSVTEILTNQLFSDEQKYEQLIKQFELMQWSPVIEKFEETDLFKFTLTIEYEKFTCFLLGTEKGLKTEVVEYFSDMMLVSGPKEFIGGDGPYDQQMSLELFSF